MALKHTTNTSQTPLIAEFRWNTDDTMKNTAGIEQSLGASGDFVVVRLPAGSVVIGGHLRTESAVTATTYSITLGDEDTTNRYMAKTDKKPAASTALTATGFVNTGGLDVVMNVDADTITVHGTLVLRVEYVIDKRVNEVS